jgi:CYTH domain-containing protein
MPTEIERKFLVTDERWREGVITSSSIRQAYIAQGNGRSGAIVRVRIRGDRAMLTVKGPSTGLTRDEFEYEIPTADAEHMLAMMPIGKVLRKTRHLVRYAGRTWEVDVFDAPHSGLVLAEIELLSEADTPTLPEWLGPEVTGNPAYANATLAGVPNGGA